MLQNQPWKNPINHFMDSSIGSILKLAPPLIWVGSLALLAPPNQCSIGAEAPWLDCWQSIEDGPETMLLSFKVILRLSASQRGPVVHLRSAPWVMNMWSMNPRIESLKVHGIHFFELWSMQCWINYSGPEINKGQCDQITSGHPVGRLPMDTSGQINWLYLLYIMCMTWTWFWLDGYQLTQCE